MDKSVADMLSNPGIKDILSQLEQLQRLKTALGDSKLQELLASTATNTSTQAKPAPSPMPASSSSTMGPTAVNTPAICTPVTMPGQEFEDLSKLPVGTQMPYCAICVSFCNYSTEQHGKRPNTAEKKNDFDPRKIICKNCGKTGHSWKHCDDENFDEDRVLASIVAQKECSNKGGRNATARHVGCSVLGRGAEPLVRTQFLGHPPTLNFGANHIKKWIQHPQKTPIPFLSPHNPHCRGGFFGGGSKS